MKDAVSQCALAGCGLSTQPLTQSHPSPLSSPQENELLSEEHVCRRHAKVQGFWAGWCGNAVTLASSTPGDGDGDGKGKGEEDGEGDGSRSLPDAATVSGSSQASVAKPSPFRTN